MFRRYPRTKNAAERACIERLLAGGWTVQKRGWPDFIAWRNGELACIEVKRDREQPAKPDQWRVIQRLAQQGLKCFLWSPDAGLQRMYGDDRDGQRRPIRLRRDVR